MIQNFYNMWFKGSAIFNIYETSTVEGGLLQWGFHLPLCHQPLSSAGQGPPDCWGWQRSRRPPDAPPISPPPGPSPAAAPSVSHSTPPHPSPRMSPVITHQSHNDQLNGILTASTSNKVATMYVWEWATTGIKTPLMEYYKSASDWFFIHKKYSERETEWSGTHKSLVD